jgi:hypothetical protein
MIEMTVEHTGENMSFKMLVPGERVTTICAKNHGEMDR